MTKHTMVDLETLGVDPDSVVLTLGAVIFDPFSDVIFDQLYLRIDIDEQTTRGRKIDNNTVEWWAKQDVSVMEDTFSENDRISMNDAMDKFCKFFWGSDKIWSHGSSFDIIIIENLLKQLGKSKPWDYWQIRDTRTLFDLGVNPNMPTSNKHNALADAVRQAIGVQNCYKKLFQK